jgi:hypothetical protein
LSFAVEFYADSRAAAVQALDALPAGTLPTAIRSLLALALQGGQPGQLVHVKTAGHLEPEGTQWGAVSSVELTVRWVPFLSGARLATPPAPPASPAPVDAGAPG